MTRMNLLILTFTLSLQMVMRVRCFPVTALENRKQNRSKPIQRLAFLYTRHTAKFVKVTSKRITALTNKDNRYAELLLTSHSLKGEHSIQGKHSKKFVCMNRKGEVVLKTNFNETRCMFYIRTHDSGYTTFRLVSNPAWFLGFKKNGNVRHGHKTDYDNKAAWMMIERPSAKP